MNKAFFTYYQLTNDEKKELLKKASEDKVVNQDSTGKPVSKHGQVKNQKSGKKNKKPWAMITLCIVIAVIAAVILFGNKNDDKPEPETQQANSFEINRLDLPKDVIAAGGQYTVGLKSDGTVVAAGDNEYGQCDVSEWEDIIAVSAGINHTISLKSDGTVVAVGKTRYGQCNVSEWKDITAVSAGGYHTIGLKSDGTVVAVGDNEDGQCKVSEWKDITAISACASHTIGLKADGTVVAVGDNGDGQCNVSEWKDITAVSGGYHHTIGLKNDATVVASGSNELGQCDVSEWKDIIAISAGVSHTVGLKADGTVVAVGDDKEGQCDVSEWKDIIAISAGFNHTVGLKSDGTVVAVGYSKDGEYDVSEWKDISTVSANRNYSDDNDGKNGFVESECKYVDNGDNGVALTKYIASEQMSDIKIPEKLGGKNVTIIESNAFEDCEYVKTIDFPVSVAEIKDKAFCNCPNLESIQIPSLCDISESAFYNCRKEVVIKRVTSYVLINNSDNSATMTKYIGGYFEAVEVPEELDGKTVTIIESNAFENCESLKTITFPDSVIKIKDKAFCNCPKLEKIQISSDCDISEKAFMNCGKVNVERY